MGNNRIAKRVYVGKYIISFMVVSSQKMWTDSVNDCLKKNELWIFHKQGEWCMIEINDKGL